MNAQRAKDGRSKPHDSPVFQATNHSTDSGRYVHNAGSNKAGYFMLDCLRALKIATVLHLGKWSRGEPGRGDHKGNKQIFGP